MAHCKHHGKDLRELSIRVAMQEKILANHETNVDNDHFMKEIRKLYKLHLLNEFYELTQGNFLKRINYHIKTIFSGEHFFYFPV